MHNTPKHATTFEPYHLYEIDPNFPLARGIPYTYFLCLTNVRKAAHSERHNIVGLPVLPGSGGQEKDLRLPLYTKGQANSTLQITGEVNVALDLIQPLPYDALKPFSRGEITVQEREELLAKIRDFLAL